MTTPALALSNSLQALALRQWRDYQWATPGRAFADPELLLTAEEAYAVQMEVARLRCAAGDAVAGYKIGCIGPGVVKQFGMSGPIHARLFRSEIHEPGCMLRHAAYANLAIEGEMALRIGDNANIVAAFPVIELHHFVFRAQKKTLVELIANNGTNAGAVVPRMVKRCRLTIGGMQRPYRFPSMERPSILAPCGQCLAARPRPSTGCEAILLALAKP